MQITLTIKKKIITLLFITISTLLTSCFSYTTTIGKGAQGSEQVTEWNHYLVYGLVPAQVSNPKNMAFEKDNYTVYTRMSFVNGLLSALTFGIYTPTTTTVTK